MSATSDSIKQNGKPSPALLTSNRVAAAGPALGRIGRRLPDAPPETGIGLNITADTYEQIGCDPEASAALMLLAIFVLADGVQLSPAVGEKDPKYQRAVDIKDHLDRTFTGLERELKATLEMLLRPAMQFGNKIAEKVYDIPTTGPDAYKLVLKSIKVKPRGSASFVVDEFMNLLGLVPTRRPAMIAGSNRATDLNADEVIPPEKFVIATFRMQDEDPRGRSIYRPIVKAWNLKQLTMPEFLTYLMRCAIPGLKIILSEGAQDRIVVDSNGDPVIDALTGKPKVIDAITEHIQAGIEFKNSTVMAAEHGTLIDALEVGENEGIFDSAFAFLNKEIRKGILLQELATADAAHQTKGSTSEQMGIVNLLVWAIKHWFAESVIRRQICQPQVGYNFGEEDARELTPKVALGDYDRKDWAADSEAVVALVTATVIDENGSTMNALTSSQIQSLLTQIGLPAPTEEEIAAIRAKAEERAQQAKQQLPQQQPPGKQPDGGQEDERKAA